MKKVADVECRSELAIVIHLLHQKKIIDDHDIENIKEGIFEFPVRDGS